MLLSVDFDVLLDSAKDLRMSVGLSYSNEF